MFDKRIAERYFDQMAKSCSLRILQIFLAASHKTRVARAEARAKFGGRHLMHGDSGSNDQAIIRIAHRIRRFRTGYTRATHHYFSEPLNLSCGTELLRVDTDDLDGPQIDDLHQKIRTFLRH